MGPPDGPWWWCAAAGQMPGQTTSGDLELATRYAIPCTFGTLIPARANPRALDLIHAGYLGPTPVRDEHSFTWDEMAFWPVHCPWSRYISSSLDFIFLFWPAHTTIAQTRLHAILQHYETTTALHHVYTRAF